MHANVWSAGLRTTTARPAPNRKAGAKGLAVPCGRVPTRGNGFALARLPQGRTPRPGVVWPAQADLELGLLLLLILLLFAGLRQHLGRVRPSVQAAMNHCSTMAAFRGLPRGGRMVPDNADAGETCGRFVADIVGHGVDNDRSCHPAGERDTKQPHRTHQLGRGQDWSSYVL